MFDSLICWSAMTESVEAHCLECPVVVTFKTRPGYTTCKGWGRSSTDLVGPALSSREGWRRVASQGAEEEVPSCRGYEDLIWWGDGSNDLSAVGHADGA
jgi:hypothetical protein